ncbi:hypothetical protein CDEST_04058 [Colletotrichum destructivum]|uniref:Uncharacterized protein n=1 Tax=Colletotrichum destructivum TaxID=34406 RepID=A0AAX4I7Y7_9PEZI|nr:hypothetical protein CDEST_04058 [Colletotrichum destructivum]
MIFTRGFFQSWNSLRIVGFALYRPLRSIILPFAVFILVLGSLTSFLPNYPDPSPTSPQRLLKDKKWINNRPYWLDRHVGPSLTPTIEPNWCWWKNLCRKDLRSLHVNERKQTIWEPTLTRPSPRDCKSERRKIQKAVPEYVLEHAPLVHLHSDDNFWPANIAEHLLHMTPIFEERALNRSITLSNLHLLNSKRGHVYLTSKEDIESKPE